MKENIISLDGKSDGSIIDDILQGNVAAYSLLVERYQSAVRAFLVIRLNTPHEAEDLAQETFIIAFKKIAEFNSESSFLAWLRGIAAYLLKNHQRKHRAVALGSADELEHLINQHIDENIHEGVELDMFDNLTICLEKLSEKMRNLLTEHYTLGVSLAELCRKYEDKHSTMTMRLFRIRQSLKTCIDKRIQQQQR